MRRGQNWSARPDYWSAFDGGDARWAEWRAAFEQDVDRDYPGAPWYVREDVFTYLDGATDAAERLADLRDLGFAVDEALPAAPAELDTADRGSPSR